MSAYDVIIDALRSAGSLVRETGTDKAMAQCPAHDDANPSLQISARSDGKGVTMCCHAGCDYRDVLAAVGLSPRDLYDDPAMRDVYKPNTDYVYPNGQHKRRRTGPDGAKRMSWPKGANGGRALYLADKIPAGCPLVFLVESEKAAQAIWAMGAVAVATGGAMRGCDMTPLQGIDVTAVVDRDTAGLKWAARQHKALDGVAAVVRFTRTPLDIDKADAVEHFDHDLTLTQLQEFDPFTTSYDTEPEPPEHGAVYTPLNTTATPQHSSSTEVPTLARLRRILDKVAAEVRSRGLVGEERLAQTLYLILTSRLLDKQVSAGVKGHSASGKSYTVETVARFFPPEAYLEFTAMSERALVYSTEQFAHRTLIVYEVTALREGVEDDMTAYFIRSLLSEGRIDYEVTIRAKDGGFTTRKITKQGPTNLIFTTTKTRVHAENETRILSLATDDSTAQTARVLAELADETNGAGDDDLQEWRDLQRWLADAEHRVTIPYAKALTKRIPPVAVRLRRDVGALLSLIRAHAVLHQVTRDRDDDGRIVATLDDYAVVRELVADTIAEGVGATVSATVRETVAAVAELTNTEHAEVGLRAIAERLRLDKSNVSRRLRMAADGGYLRNLEDKRGKPGRWTIGDPLPEAVDLLPDPAQLATPGTLLDLECCGVAPGSEGDNRLPP